MADKRAIGEGWSVTLSQVRRYLIRRSAHAPCRPERLDDHLFMQPEYRSRIQ